MSKLIGSSAAAGSGRIVCSSRRWRQQAVEAAGMKKAPPTSCSAWKNSSGSSSSLQLTQRGMAGSHTLITVALQRTDAARLSSCLLLLACQQPPQPHLMSLATRGSRPCSSCRPGQRGAHQSSTVQRGAGREASCLQGCTACQDAGWARRHLAAAPSRLPPTWNRCRRSSVQKPQEAPSASAPSCARMLISPPSPSPSSSSSLYSQ